MTGTEMLAYLQTLSPENLRKPVVVRVGTDDYREAHVIVAVPDAIDIHLRT